VAGVAEEIFGERVVIPKVRGLGEVAVFVDIRRGPGSMQKENNEHQRNFEEAPGKRQRSVRERTGFFIRLCHSAQLSAYTGRASHPCQLLPVTSIFAVSPLWLQPSSRWFSRGRNQ